MSGLYLAYADSPLGRMLLTANEDGLTEVKFLFPEDEIVPEVEPSHPTLEQTKQQLKEYFAGDRKTFDLPLAPHGSDFQKRVWQELVTIPWGQTTSYLKMADKLGSRLTIRAVGGANGKNPIAIIIPCHRVIGANGNLTGYAGGLWRKQRLLELEGMANQMKMF